MAYTITYLGSQVETSLDKTIILANCTTLDNDALVIFAGGLDPAGAPTVEYGGVSIVGDDWRIAPLSRLAGGMWHKSSVWNGRTADITVTFGTNITRRYIVAYSVTNGGRLDQVKRNVQDTETTFANTLLTDAELGTNNEQLLSYHLSNGPITDAAGSFDSYGFTGLHRVGSSIGTDDITIQTGQLETALLDKTRSGLNVTTARQFISGLIALRPIVAIPALDSQGSEIFIGDTVDYGLGTDVVANLVTTPGHPFVKVVLSAGLVYNSYVVTLI